VIGAAISSVALAGGGRLACGHLVNAAGPWAGRLAALAGVDLPVGPRKRMSYVFDCRAELPGMPLVVDPSGLAFRPEGRQFMAILSPPPEDDPETEDLTEDYAPFEREIWPILAARVPAFAAIKATGAWAGLYDHNSLDRNAVLGRHPEIANFHFCAGFSGHGLQQAPAAGRAVAETIVHGRFLSLDVSALGYRRVLQAEPLAEVNVV
jgi:FAD-dependent oxidoreductase domain-containing protein 1